MIKQNRERTIKQFTRAAKVIVNHLYNDHQYCGDWCQAVQATKKGKVYVNPRGWLSKHDEKGQKLYSQISDVTKKYGNEFYLSQSLHPFDTKKMNR